MYVVATGVAGGTKLHRLGSRKLDLAYDGDGNSNDGDPLSSFIKHDPNAPLDDGVDELFSGRALSVSWTTDEVNLGKGNYSFRLGLTPDDIATLFKKYFGNTITRDVLSETGMTVSDDFIKEEALKLPLGELLK
jgi:hypothetical protein